MSDRPGATPEVVGTVRWLPDTWSTVTSRGLRLEVWDWGEPEAAEVVVVCAHGYLDCAAFFAPLATDLEAGVGDVAVRALSFAGHGRSEWAGSYGWTDHTADLLAVLAATRRVAPRARLCLLGHSFGGVQAAHVAGRSGLVDLLVDVDAVAPPARTHDGSLLDVVREVAEGERARRTLPTYPSVEHLAERRARSNPRLPAALLRRLAWWLGRQLADGSWTWRLDPLLTGRVRPWDVAPGAPEDPLVMLRRSAGPKLVVTGEAEDHPLIRGPHPGDAAIDSLPDLTHVRVPDAGHYVHLERRGVVAAAVRRFLAGHA